MRGSRETEAPRVGALVVREVLRIADLARAVNCRFDLPAYGRAAVPEELATPSAISGRYVTLAAEDP
jgi:hypothetical protein